MADETTPLLDSDAPSDPHTQFCRLIGTAPPTSILTTSATAPSTVSNTVLLSQGVLSATLTALGASESSHVLITIFGVLNTIIVGLVEYLKPRGQPIRAPLFRDDLEHVVTEIDNSETMWLGIKNGVHGYSEIDTDDKVSVRSEVARLTRL